MGTAWDCWALARWREPFCTCARPHLVIRTGHNRCSTPHLPLWTPLRCAQRLLHHYPIPQAWGHCLRGPLFCTFSLTRIHKALTLELSRELISRLTCTTLAITFRSRLLAHSASSRAVALPNRSHTLNRRSSSSESGVTYSYKTDGIVGVLALPFTYHKPRAFKHKNPRGNHIPQ